MKQYEVTFIVDPVLSGDEIKSTAAAYESMLKDAGCTIVHFDDMGLKTMAYAINKRTSGFYYCIEFQNESGSIISKLELALKRDERIMRFLTIALDKYGVKYNEDKRNGVIGKVKKKSKTKSENSEIAVEPSAKAEMAPVAISQDAVPVAPAAIATVLGKSEEE